jgi:formylglycine-generating enzyme required for sulfatase activity
MKLKVGHSFVLPLNSNGIDNITEQPMIWVEPGSFMMGSRSDEIGYYELEDGLPFLATISKGFWLGQYLLTQSCWSALVKNNPSQFQRDGRDRPVENVSWDDATNFCKQLNEHFSDIIPVNYGFSLPTEMQWEYACRAGTETMHYTGNSEEDLARAAWFIANSGGQTHAVGQKEANALGFFDMHGNVSEWCFDQPVDYPKISATDWVGKSGLNFHTYRGGSWEDEQGGLRSAASAYAIATLKRPTIGFRLSLRYIDQ